MISITGNAGYSTHFENAELRLTHKKRFPKGNRTLLHVSLGIIFIDKKGITDSEVAASVPLTVVL